MKPLAVLALVCLPLMFLVGEVQARNAWPQEAQSKPAAKADPPPQLPDKTQVVILRNSLTIQAANDALQQARQNVLGAVLQGLKDLGKTDVESCDFTPEGNMAICGPYDVNLNNFYVVDTRKPAPAPAPKKP